MILGIIDVGTNTAHLVIVRLNRDGTNHVMHEAHDRIRLGEGAFASGVLTKRALTRTATLLARYGRVLQRLRVARVEAVATSALREAKNGRAFVHRVRSKLGLPLRIISGREEARLIYRGVAREQRLRRRCVMIAIGGGSAQVMRGRATSLEYATSVPLGAARLARRFLRHHPPRPQEIQALDRAVRRAWAPVARSVRRHRCQEALGCSAAIAQLLKTIGGRTVTPRSLHRFIERHGAPTSRDARLALVTGLSLLAWMEGSGVFRIRYARGSLREGMVVEARCRKHLNIP